MKERNNLQLCANLCQLTNSILDAAELENTIICFRSRVAQIAVQRKSTVTEHATLPAPTRAFDMICYLTLSVMMISDDYHMNTTFKS